MFNRQKSYRLVITCIALVAVTAFTFALTKSGSFNLFGTASTEAKTEKAAKPLTFGVCDTAGPIEVESSTGTAAGVPTPYATLGAAFVAINGAVIHTGVITIDVCGNTDELAVSAVLNGVTASYTTLTISPAGGAARTITGAPAGGSALIDLDGADNVTINGVNSGGNTLTMVNTTGGGTALTSTIRFQNDASNNTIQNATVNGAGTATSNGTIIIGTSAAGTTGNDNNTITGCNVGPVGASLPINAILGTGTAANPNDNIQITNNNIFDFFSAATDGPRGVLASVASNGWTITGNSFYQTATRTFTGTVVMRVISIENTSSTTAFTISNNFIGGSAPSAGGTAWTQAGAVSHNFIGIRISAGTAVATSVQNNTIQNISITNTSTSSVGAAISLPSGSVNVGTITANTIGSQSTTGSITQTNASAGFFSGILSQPGTLGTVNISNNLIGGITVAGAGAQTLRGIRIETGTATSITISNNTIGSTTTANSMDSNGGASLLGISTTNATAFSNITGNTIQNFRHTSTATGASFRGIEATGSINGHNISTNTIRDVTSASTSTSTTTTAALAGILANGTSNARTIFFNNIFNLSNSAASATVHAVGIVTGSSGSSGTMNANNIYNLSIVSTSTTASVKGFYLFNVAGTAPWNLTNNMVRIGTGLTATINPLVRGIHEDTASGATNNIWNNSIYIGGTQGAATVNSACIFRAIAGIMDIRNNILWNTRSSTGAPGVHLGRHYAIESNVATGTLTSNFNNLFVNGASGATVGFITSDRVTLADWRAAVAGFDTSSFSTDPLFVDPTNATTPDLHLLASNPESNAAQTLAAVTTDFDGAVRPQPAATNPDIGADEGVFTVSSDLQAPAITYTPLGNTGSTANRIQTVTITDNAGVATGGLAPRIYFNKNAGANFSTPCALASGSLTNGTWDCTIDNTLVGGVIVTDVIRFFVVAQDAAGNLAANPSAGFTGTDVTIVTTPPTTPNLYNIVTAFSGSFSVGAAETITSLTNAGGIFELINAGALSGNVTVNITSDLAGELGTVALNQWSEDGLGGYTILIKPSGAPRMITGSSLTALIRLNGADRVRIDGSTAATLFEGLKEDGNVESVVGGNPALRELTIENTSAGTSSAVVAFMSGTNGAQSDTIQNVNIDGTSPTTTLLGVHNGGNTVGTAGTDNDGNRVINCRIRRALFGIYSTGAIPPNQNIGTRIEQNDISATGSDRIRRGGILVFNDNGIQIVENHVGGIDNTGESFDAFGIGVGTQFADEAFGSSGGIVNANVNRNRVNGVSQDATFSAFGIGIAGGNTPAGLNNVVSNNMVTGVISDGNAGDLVAGIFVVGTPGSDTRLYYNSVAMTGDRSALLTPASAQLPSYGIAITGANPVVELKNNIFYTTQIAEAVANPGALSFGIGMQSATFGNLNSNFNDFFSSGVRDGGFRTTSLGNTGGVNLPTLVSWTTATGDDTSPDSMEADPLFVSPLTNLHLGTIFSPVYDQGTIVSVLDDHDAQIRSVVGFAAGIPDIGADEILAPLAATASISGRVVTADGRGIRNAIVVISGGNLTEPRTVATGSFGYFAIGDLQVGQTYLVTVNSKRFVFPSPTVVVTLQDNVEDLIFQAFPGGVSREEP